MCLSYMSIKLLVFKFLLKNMPYAKKVRKCMHSIIVLTCLSEFDFWKWPGNSTPPPVACVEKCM